MDLHQPDRAGRVPPLRLGAGRQQPAQHLVGRPADGGDGGDAQPLVHLGAARVVDAGHHVVDVEGLAHHPGGQDVGVVAVGHGGESLGLLDAGLEQHLAVEADALDRLAVEVGTQPAERLGVLVDDRDGVAALLQTACQGGSDASAAHDHDVHGHESSGRGPLARDPQVSGRRSITAVRRVNPAEVAKRLLIGRQLRSTQLGETLLPKRIALPVFASDALSSVAYAPDEILLTLSWPGWPRTRYSWKIAILVAVVMLVVVASYRQNVHAYPSGGGDYEVATTNLGPNAGLTVASALMVDYVLTVAVSISSGVQNAKSVLPVHRRSRGLGGRGRGADPDGAEPPRRARVRRRLRHPGLLLHGRHHRHGRATGCSGSWCSATRCGRTAPSSGSRPTRSTPPSPASPWSLLLARAFSSGWAALTGVEAISNGVPAFRKPKSKNAATTLLLLGTIAVTMLIGVVTLANLTGLKLIDAAHSHYTLNGQRVDVVEETAIGQLARAVFSDFPPGFYFVVAPPC